jgi:hypothetical protein
MDNREANRLNEQERMRRLQRQLDDQEIVNNAQRKFTDLRSTPSVSIREGPSSPAHGKDILPKVDTLEFRFESREEMDRFIANNVSEDEVIDRGQIPLTGMFYCIIKLRQPLALSNTPIER